MTDLEFISLFRVEELPDCATGLFLLKAWLETDLNAIASLQSTGHLDLRLLCNGGSLSFQAWLEHIAICAVCLLIYRPMDDFRSSHSMED